MAMHSTMRKTYKLFDSGDSRMPPPYNRCERSGTTTAPSSRCVCVGGQQGAGQNAVRFGANYFVSWQNTHQVAIAGVRTVARLLCGSSRCVCVLITFTCKHAYVRTAFLANVGSAAVLRPSPAVCVVIHFVAV